MNALKIKLNEYEDALFTKSRLARDLKILELTIDKKDGYMLGGDATFFDHTGNSKSAISLKDILPAKQLVELIQNRIDALNDFIVETEPVLKMAEMAFKGMEKKS